MLKSPDKQALMPGNERTVVVEEPRRPHAITMFDMILAVNGQRAVAGSRALKKAQCSKPSPQATRYSSIPAHALTSAKSSSKPGAKRKQKFSSMKKRILLARLKQHLEKQRIQSLAMNTDASDEPRSFTTVIVSEFAEHEDISDNDEREEIFDNLRILASPFGEVVGMSIVEGLVCDIAVTFRSPSEASNALRGLEGLVIAGKALKTRISSCLSPSETMNPAGSPLEHQPHLPAASQGKDPSSLNNSIEAILCLRNLVLPEDLEDAEEAEEVLSNIQALCEDYGNISTVYLKKETPLSSSGNVEAIASVVDPLIVIELNSLVQSLNVIRTLNGMVVAGKSLACRLFVSCSADKETITGCATSWQDEVFKAVSFTFPFAVIADSQISQSSVISFKSLDDLRVFLETNDISSVVRIEAATESVDKSNTDNDKFVFCIGPNSRFLVSVGGFVSDEDLQDAGPEEIAQMKRDLLSLVDSHELLPRRMHITSACLLEPRTVERACSDKYSESIIGCVGFARSSDAVAAMLALHGTSIGGLLVDASVEYTNTTQQNKAALTSELCDDNRRTEQPPLKYSDAINKQHLPKHTSPVHSNIPVATAEIEGLLHVMLDSLATFQKRLKERDPLKAKARQRFVVGVKQATNATKAGKVRLLVLAPDTEASDELDSKIDVLLSLALAARVPTIYAMSRRRLAKACQLSMRQSVVAVYDPDGAYKQFKEITKFIQPEDS